MSAVRLERVAFVTSRLGEFVGEKELVAQVGQNKEEWPLVILKELVDNALDECEEAEIPPKIKIELDTAAGSFIIADNGRGIPTDTVKSMLDYSVRVSTREAYVSPTRGAQGNALKTLVAMGFALDRTRGETVIEARGQAHHIIFEMDAVRREPKIDHGITASTVKTGTRVTTHWPDSACSITENAKSRFLQMATDFIWLNPHLTLSCEWDGELCVNTKAADPGWRKWKACDQTSAHWYSLDSFSRYMAAHIAHDRDNGGDRPLREFVAELRGLSGSRKPKAVLDLVGGSRMSLASFFAEGKNPDGIARLLAACRMLTKPVKPADLGAIGEANLRAQMLADGADEETIQYKRIVAVSPYDGLPFIIEAAFGYCPEAEPARRMVTGVNWSAAIGDPFARIGPSQSLSSLLAEQRAGATRPINFFLHFITPRAQFADRGKAVLRLSTHAEEMEECVRAVTAKWAKQIKAEERHASAVHRRHQNLIKSERRVTLKEAAWEVMEAAYLKASDGGELPAKARQIMYPARPGILERTGRATLDDAYFTQTLLVGYIEEHPEQCANWDITWDARGKLVEPHTGIEVPLGTIEVRQYLGLRAMFGSAEIAVRFNDLFPTNGPEHRYDTILVIEKEGFDPLINAARIRERYDIGVISLKGMSVTAARKLLDALADRGVHRVLMLHDFDVAGFSICGTLGTTNRRYRFINNVNLIDIGLRLADVEEMSLESEPVATKGEWDKRVATLKRHGATDAEVDFLRTRRVELNAMTSRQIVDRIETKLTEHGVKKIIPDDATIERHARSVIESQLTEKAVEAIAKEVAEQARAAKLPADLRAQIERAFEKESEPSWDAVVARIMRAQVEKGMP